MNATHFRVSLERRMTMSVPLAHHPPPLYTYTLARKAAWRTKGETTKGPRHEKLNDAARILTVSGKILARELSLCVPFFRHDYSTTLLPHNPSSGVRSSGVALSLLSRSTRGVKAPPCRRTTPIDASCSSSQECLRPRDWSGRRCNQGGESDACKYGRSLRGGREAL